MGGSRTWCGHSVSPASDAGLALTSHSRAKPEAWQCGSKESPGATWKQHLNAAKSLSSSSGSSGVECNSQGNELEQVKVALLSTRVSPPCMASVF